MPPAAPPVRVGGVRRRFTGISFGIGYAIPVAMGLFALLAIVVPLVAVVGNTGVSAVSSVPAVTSGPVTSTPATGRSSAVSYLTVNAVRAGLARVARLAPGARVAMLRVDAKTFNATASFANGAAKQIYLGPAGTVVASGSIAGLRLIPISHIDPSVVGRLVAQMHRRFHVRIGEIDYMVLSWVPGEAPRWVVFSKAPGHPGYLASLDGTDLSRLPG